MIKVPKQIKELFLNPKNDSISGLIRDIKMVHSKILENTDLSKGTLISNLTDNKFAVDNFSISSEGISKKEFAEMVSKLYKGVPRWHSPNTMYNVAPPPLTQTVVAKTFTSLYNPNLVLETTSGESILTEKKVIKAIAEYVGWNFNKSGGIFTFGGKATTMYGIKMGLKKCSPDSSEIGVKDDVIVLSTKSGHPSHISDAQWLGIGTRNVFRLNTDKEGRINLSEFELFFREKIKEGKKIAIIIISGGTTNDMVVDPIKEVVELRDRLSDEFKLNYRPHVHVDSVVGFPWIFFKDYNFTINHLKISKDAVKKISEIIKDLKNLNHADSFGIDFHKMGFCPYISSLFMIKDKTIFYGTQNNEEKSGQNAPFLYSIENSRTGDGPNSAFVALNVLGVNGFQFLIAHLTEIAIDLQKKLIKTGSFEIVNKTGLGSSVIFVPFLPKNIIFSNLDEETVARNSYVSSFIKEINQTGNTFYIDKIPSNSTGANPYPFIALKAYIMSPYSSKKSNSDFVVFIGNIKKKIDLKFDFKNTFKIKRDDFFHPLK